MQIACPSTLRGSVPVAVSGPAVGPSAIATRRTYARGEARVNARPAPYRFCAAFAQCEVAAVLAAVEHVLHERGDARRVGAAHALELASAGGDCL